MSDYPKTITAPVGTIHVETVLGPVRLWGIAFNSNEPEVPKDLIQTIAAKLMIDGEEKSPSQIVTWLGQEFPNGSTLMATVVLLGPNSYIHCPSVNFSFK